MDERPETAKFGYFALVAYLPQPLSNCLEDIRRSLSASITSQVHITLLPPRPLRIPIADAADQVKQILTRFPEFEVELWEVRAFPETNTIYLDVSDGAVQIKAVHRELNVGDLAHAEEFEFRPHLTLSGPCTPAEAAQSKRTAQVAWDASDCSPRFTVREVVFLWIEPGAAIGEWQRIGSQTLASADGDRPLGAAATSGRTS